MLNIDMNAGIRKLAWRHKWFEWFHAVYATIVIITAFSSIYPDDPSIKELILLVAFTSYTAILLFFLIIFTFKFSRKARYSEATKCIHSALHNARDAYHYLDWCMSDNHSNISFDEDKLCNYMTTALTSIASAFTLVSGVKCRTSIKVIGQNDDNELYASTLARDAVSKTEREYQDRNEGQKHLIASNTDFRLITDDGRRCFSNGNLPKYQDYLNTSEIQTKGGKWMLPYKSTIVWPIRYVYTNSESVKFNNTEDLFGFLTVDSSSVNAFIDKYDIEMGAALADALFPVLNALVKLKSSN